MFKGHDFITCIFDLDTAWTPPIRQYETGVTKRRNINVAANERPRSRSAFLSKHRKQQQSFSNLQRTAMEKSFWDCQQKKIHWRLNQVLLEQNLTQLQITNRCENNISLPPSQIHSPPPTHQTLTYANNPSPFPRNTKRFRGR